VIRACSAKSVGIVRRIYTLSSIGFLIRFLIPYFFGICALVFIMDGDMQLKELFFPAPGGAEAVDNLYAMPLFLGRILPPVVIGIISAGMIAAFMSTHDSYLLCWSTVLTQDVVAPLFGDDLKPKTRIWLSRMFIVLIGVYVFYWGLMYGGGEDVWDYMAVTGAIYFTGALALLAGGLYWKRASSTGAVLALLSGCSAVFGLTPVQAWVGRALTAIGHATALLPVDRMIDVTTSSARVGLFSIVFTIFAMVVGSLLFPDKPKPEQEGEAPADSPQTT